MRFLVTFYSVSSALLVETAGKERGFSCAVIPVPRKLSSSCGYAVEVEAEESACLVEFLRDIHAEWEAVYCSVGNGYEALHRNGA